MAQTSAQYRALIHKRNKANGQKKVSPKQAAKLHKLRATERDNDPTQLTRPLTPKTLRQETDAALRLKFGPQEQSFNQELGISDVQQQHIGNWFDQYKADIAAAASRTAGAYGTATSQIQQGAQQAGSADEERRKALMDSMASDARTRGATLDPGLEQQSQQANASRAAASNAALAQTATVGANAGAYLADAGRIAGLSQTQEHLKESTRKTQIRSSLRDLAGQKGDYAIQLRQQARGSERNAQIAEAAGLLKEQQVATQEKLAGSLISDRKTDNKRQAKNARQRKMEADRKYRLDLKKHGEAVAKDRYQRAHGLGPYKKAAGKGGGGSGGTTPKFTQTQINASASALRTWTSKAKLVRGKHPQWTEARIRQELNAASGAPDPIIAYAAVQRAIYGGVGSKTQKQLLRNFGVRAKRFRPKSNGRGPNGTGRL